MIKKGQVKGIEQENSESQVKFIELLFEIAAQSNVNGVDHSSLETLAAESRNYRD